MSEEMRFQPPQELGSDVPAVSLVVGSLGRRAELHRLLTSVRRQTLKSVEVIIIDQSGSDALRAVLDDFSDLLLHVVRAGRGVSRARNIGLARARSPILGFPDDDCWYPPSTLEAICDRFARRPPATAAVAARVITPTGAMIRYPRGPYTSVPRRLAFRTVVSPGLFARRAAALQISGFSEHLGLGARTPYGSGEETDFALRLLASDFVIEYAPSVIVYHPSPTAVPGRTSVQVGVAYGRGYGYVMRHHHLAWSVVGPSLVRPVVGAVAALAAGRLDLARFRLAVAKGRALGYTRAPITKSPDHLLRPKQESQAPHDEA